MSAPYPHGGGGGPGGYPPPPGNNNNNNPHAGPGMHHPMSNNNMPPGSNQPGPNPGGPQQQQQQQQHPYQQHPQQQQPQGGMPYGNAPPPPSVYPTTSSTTTTATMAPSSSSSMYPPPQQSQQYPSGSVGGPLPISSSTTSMPQQQGGSSSIPGGPGPGPGGVLMDSSSERSAMTTATAQTANTVTNAAPTIVAATANTATTATAPGLTTPTTTNATTNPAAEVIKPNVSALTDQSVLEYLKQKGMSSAVIELQTLLSKYQEKPTDGSNTTTTNDDNNNNKDNDAMDISTTAAGSSSASQSMKEQLERDDELARSQRSILTKSTGGGFGYDRDAAAPIVQWGVPDVPSAKGRLGGAGAGAAGSNNNNSSNIGVDEARSYLDAFCRLQLWVLTLPDDPQGRNVQPQTVNVIAKAKEYIMGKNNNNNNGNNNNNNNENNNDNDKDKEEDAAKRISSLSTFIGSLSKPSQSGGGGGGGSGTSASSYSGNYFHLPPSAKPELLSVTFALLVHTYCELLEVGMETTAHTLRDAFHPVYEPIFGEELRDLYHCTTTEDMVKLNTHNSQHMEALNNLKTILVQVAQFQLKQEELMNQQQQQQNQSTSTLSAVDAQLQQQQTQQRLQEYQQTINVLQQKHKELSARASAAFDRMYDLPFLRRARAVRWQLTLSTSSYGLLAGFLSSNNMSGSDSSLLAMSTLLQTKCELHVEQRDPLPFTPTVILEDTVMVGGGGDGQGAALKSKTLNERVQINWAAPLPHDNSVSVLAKRQTLPFPKFHMNEEYETERDAERDKRVVEFNRAMLVNGFRRLEALERKREFEVMMMDETEKSKSSSNNNNTEEDEGDEEGGVSSSAKNNNNSNSNNRYRQRVLADPLEPSILLATLCSNNDKINNNGSNKTNKKNSSGGANGSSITKKKKSSGGVGAGTAAAGVTTAAAAGGSDHHHRKSITSSNFDALWEESGIGLTCAKICPPDGRRVAVGCDDSAIRIWDLQDKNNKRLNNDDDDDSDDDDDGRGGGGGGGSGGGEVSQVLLGHKNGFPVFDLSWNRDGRSLLSAGGDGSIRLWDTMAQGPFGTVAKPTPSTTSTPAKKPTEKITNATAKEALEKATKALEKAKGKPDTTIPGLKNESSTYQNGAALAVYRGHARNTPIWSVAFAPCGYYFASAGGDATARLWTTDRPVPVRLFAGHTSNTIHSVSFHPNCNYVITGSEDKTARLWDIQTGSCVRLLTGCPSGIHNVQIDPSGQYAAGADATGTIHLWDLGTGKKVSELRSKNNTIDTTATTTGGASTSGMAMIHAMSFSACGTALATGGDDRYVRIWDIKKPIVTENNNNNHDNNNFTIVDTPVKSFPTRRTILLDLYYTKRNLLLSIGKYITAIPIIPTSSSD